MNGGSVNEGDRVLYAEVSAAWHHFAAWREKTLAGYLTILAGLGLVALKMPWRRAYRWSGWFWLGWKMLLPIILFAAVVGAVVGIAMLALRGQSRSTPIAFGPFLAAAGWFVLMFGPEVVTAYLGMFAVRP